MCVSVRYQKPMSALEFILMLLNISGCFPWASSPCGDWSHLRQAANYWGFLCQHSCYCFLQYWLPTSLCWHCHSLQQQGKLSTSVPLVIHILGNYILEYSEVWVFMLEALLLVWFFFFFFSTAMLFWKKQYIIFEHCLELFYSFLILPGLAQAAVFELRKWNKPCIVYYSKEENVIYINSVAHIPPSPSNWKMNTFSEIFAMRSPKSSMVNVLKKPLPPPLPPSPNCLLRSPH